MAKKDHTHHFTGLADVGAPITVENTVSRHVKTGDRSFIGLVTESRKPLVDADFNAHQDIVQEAMQGVRRWQIPSGFLRGQTHFDGMCDYTFGNVGAGITNPSGTYKQADHTLKNAVVMDRMEAVVAGHHVTVEFTETDTVGKNIIPLQTPTVYDGTNATHKRTDFVFLEVWKALVAPSKVATGTVTIVTNADISNGDTITINGNALTFVAGPAGVDQVVKGVDEAATATAVAAAINDAGNSYSGDVVAVATGAVVTLYAQARGAAGNAVTLAVNNANAGATTASGATLAGGEDRPHKPAQNKLYRHGNTQSPTNTWLDDEVFDPTKPVETSQRVQVQYRIRTTGASEGVNHKIHPDGFSTALAGPTPGIFARGGRATPVSNEGGRSYPFVRADGASTWNNSSAAAYQDVDVGLWVAGDGSEQAAKDLATLDGFVYAIPIAFVFRHNDAFNAASKGFDPVNNANGAPTYIHAQYVSAAIGTIAADKSDRPDGAFCDRIERHNFLDMRRHVVPAGLDLQAELLYQVQSLLDGSLSTFGADIASKQEMGGSSGDVSTRWMVCNEIGRVHQGATPTSGDTPRGETIRDFDHVARRFGSQPVVERVVFSFYPGDRSAGPPVAPGTVNTGKYVVKDPGDTDAWYEDDVLHVDLANFDVTTLGGVWHGTTGDGPNDAALTQKMFTQRAPAGTVITDILSMYHDDGHFTNAVDQQVHAKTIVGLGTPHVEIKLDANDLTVNGGDSGNADYRLVGKDGAGTDGSPRRIFVELEITYPAGAGLTDTPDHPILPDSSIYDGTNGRGPGAQVETTTSNRPKDFELLLAPRFRDGYREVQLEYVANDTAVHAGPTETNDPVGHNTVETVVSRDTTTVVFPRRVFGTGTGAQANATEITDAVDTLARTVDHPNTEYGSSSRVVKVDAAGPNGPLSGGGQTLCNVKYYPQDPVPQYGVVGAGYQVAIYFRSNAPQTAGVQEGNITTGGGDVLPEQMTLEPLAISPHVFSGQRGMGSVESSFPYVAPLEQIPVNDGTALDVPSWTAGATKEWAFMATSQVAVADFNATTGLLTLHPFVQADVQGPWKIGGGTNATKPRKDSEFRAFFPTPLTTDYRPTVMTQPLTGSVKHKVFIPFLARVAETTAGTAGGMLFRKGELVLAVLTRYGSLDTDNNIVFPDTDNRGSIALYKSRNNLLVVGTKVC